MFREIPLMNLNLLLKRENLIGKIHVANFIFTSCTHICPKMTTNMGLVEKEFENNPSSLFLTFIYKFNFTINRGNDWCAM